MRWQDVGLALLALVAGALVILTFRAVDRAPGPAATSPASTSTVDDAATSSDPEADTSTATATSSPAESPSRISAVRELLQTSDPLVIALLGDSTGNETWEWPYIWARDLAATRPVTISAWNEWTEDGYVEPQVLSTDENGDVGPLTLYGGHQSGARASYPAEHLAELVPERPDLVVLNYGHNNARDDIDADLGATLEALRDEFGEDLPVVLTLQQPQTGDANAKVRAKVHDFAEEHQLGWIDVAAAFEDQDDPSLLMADDIHPNEAGEELWAQTVAETLRVP